MLTKQKLRTFTAGAWDGYVDALVGGSGMLERAELNTPLRLAHFLAQCAHETGGLTIVRENTNWTPDQMCRLWPSRFKPNDKRVSKCRGPEDKANLAYSDRGDLGNTGGDDGWAYRGGSLLQATGRACYREIGDAIGLDLEGQPELIEDPGVGLKAALYIWTRHDLNRYADRHYGRAVSNAINRGSPFSKYDPIGHQQREQWLSRAWAVFGDGRLPDPSELHLGAYGAGVCSVQTRLKELGYPVGECDGVFGPALGRAVAAFKVDHKRDFGVELEPDETVGALTHAALQVAQPIRFAPERNTATPADLVAKGSTEAKAGLQAQNAGKALLALGVAEGARRTGGLELVSDTFRQVAVVRSTLAPAVDAIQWGLRHMGFVLVAGLGVWYWHTGHNVVMARLKAHIEGWNLSK
jgi:putative chitinase